MPYNPTANKYPLDEHLPEILKDSDIKRLLNPLQSTGSGGRGGDKAQRQGETFRSEAPDSIKRKNQEISRLQQENKKLKQSGQKGGGFGKGSKSSGKGGKKSNAPPMPKELHGMSSSSNGSPICFSYNPRGCKNPVQGNACSKGAHVCARMGCGGNHPQYSELCPKR